MGEKNTISLLTSINGYLKVIVDEAKQNKGPASQHNVQQTMTKNLNQGSVLSGAATKQEKGKFKDIAISGAMIASLNALPVVILGLAKLKHKDIEAFTKALLAIQVTVNKFAENSKEIKGAETIVKVIKSLSDLEKVGLIRLATSLKIANTLGFAGALTRFIGGVADAAKKAHSIKKEDLEKVKQMSNTMKAFSTLTKGLAVVMGVVIATAAAIKIFGGKEILKSVGLTLGVLTALSGMAIAIGILSKRITGVQSSMNQIAKFLLLMQGVVLGTLLVGVIAQKAWPQILIGFGVVSGIILGYVAVAALSSFLFKFIEMNKVAMMSVFTMAAYGMALTLGTLLVGYIAQEAWKDILIGFGAISGIILGYAAIAAVMSVVAKLSPTFKKDVAAITMMAGFSMGLVLGTLLIGAVAEQAWPDIAIGFTTIALIMEGFAGLAKLVSMTAKGVGAFQKDFITLGLFAAECEALLLGTVAIAWVTKKTGVTVGEIILTITGVGAIATALLGVAKILDTAKIKNLSRTVPFLKELAIFGGACELLLAGVIGLAILAKKADPAYVAGVVTLLGGIVYGLIKIADYVETHNKNLKNATKNLLLVEAIALGAEAILGGVITLAILAKKADPGYVIGTVVLLGGVIYGLTAIAEFMKNHNRSLATGAKNLLLVEAIALGAEAILGGVIILANHLKDPNLIWQIPTVIGLIGGIVYGLVCVLDIIKKHEKDISQGAKSMLMVEAVALGAEAILGGILGLIWLQQKLNVGIKDVFAVTTLIGGIVTGLVGVLKLIDKHNKDISKGAKSLLMVEAVAFGAEALLAGVIGLVVLARVAKVGPIEVTAVLGTIGLIVYGLVKILKQVDKDSKTLQKGAKSLMMVVACAAGAGLVLAEVIGIEKLRQVAKVGWDDVAYVLTAMTSIIIGFGLLAKVAGQYDKEVKKGVKSVAQIELLALGAGALLAGVIGLVALKNVAKASWDDIFITIGAMATIIAGFGTIAYVVGTVSKDIAKALPGIGIITLFALASEALLAGVIGLIALKNTVKADWGDIFITLGAMATIVTSFGLLGLLVGQVTPQIMPGLPGLGIITLFALASGVLLAGVIGLVALKNEAKADWGDIFITIGAMATIVTAFGVLGAAIGYATPFIAPGLVGIGLVSLLAGASELLLLGVIGLVALKNKAKVSWEDVFISIGAMATIVGAFGLLGAAIGAAVIPVSLGLLGIPTIISLGASAEILLGGIIALVDKKQKAKVKWEDVEKTLDVLTSVVTRFGLLGAAVGIAAVPVALGLLGIPTIITMGASAEILLGGIIALVDKKQKAKASWEDIDTTIDKMTDTVTSFGVLGAASSLALPFIVAGSAGLLAAIETAKQASDMLGEIVNVAGEAKKLGTDGWKTIDTTLDYMHKILVGDDKTKGFKQLCSSAAFAYPFLIAGSAGLSEVANTADLAARALITVCRAAGPVKNYNVKDITNVIKYFDEITDSLYDMVGISFGIKAGIISKQKGLIANISKSAIDIANALANIAGVAKEGGLMRSVRIKPNGEFAYGPWVNAIGSANTVATTMQGFVDILYNTFDKISAESADRIKGGMKVLQGIMEPVSNFAIAMSAFQDAGDGKIRQLKYDDKGKLIDTPIINVASVAKSIGSAISTFCNVLFSEENQSLWERMVQGGSFADITTEENGKITNGKQYNPGAAELAMGVLATVIDPVANFAQTLAMFEDGGDDSLFVPIYDEKGNLKDRREIKVTSVANKIGKAVTEFMSTLASFSGTWMGVYNNQNYDTRQRIVKSSSWGGLSKEYETIGKVGNHFADAMGVFATVITPVVSFANILKSFGDVTNGNIKVFDDKGSHEVNPKDIATNLGNAITSFITVLGNSVTKNKKLYELLGDAQDTIVSTVDAMSKSLESIAGLDTKNASDFYIMFGNIMNAVYDAGSDKNKVLVTAAVTNINSIADAISTINEKTIEKENNPTVYVLGRMHSLLLDIGKDAGSLNDIINFFKDIKSHSESFSNVLDSSVVASITNLCSTLPKLNTPLKNASDAIDKTVNDKKVGIATNANKTTAAFNRTTLSIKSFDKTLIGNNNNRIKNINNLKNAVQELDTATQNIGSRLESVANALSALSSLSTNASNGNLDRAVEALNRIGMGGGSGSGSGGSGLTAGQVVDAIKEALGVLDGTEIGIKMNSISYDGDKLNSIKGQAVLDVPVGDYHITNDYYK